MKKVNCIIIEDQIPAQQTLISYVEQTPTLNLLGAFVSPLEALDVLKSGTVDLLFLDIHLPKLSGIDLLKSMKTPPQTILTTAFSEYAVEGFDLDVVDYLLKPFSFGRFLQAIEKATATESLSNKPAASKDIFVRSKGRIKRIEIEAIQYVESKGDFALIYTNEGKETANISLQNLMEVLDSNFVRCHKSYIVHVPFIDKIVGNTLYVGEATLPIGRSYRTNLTDAIKMI